VGQRVRVPYEAPQGRRVNAIGGYFSHGPQAGTFSFLTFAALPRSRAKQPRKSAGERASDHGLTAAEVGVIDSEVFLAFAWMLAGRPAEAPAGWRRQRPLHLVVDNYSVHKSDRVKEELPRLASAGVHLFYLPPYSPELSEIEPIWQDVKYRLLPVRSHSQLGALKGAVDRGLAAQAVELRETRHLLNGPALAHISGNRRSPLY
jgi:hypothetical protein